MSTKKSNNLLPEVHLNDSIYCKLFGRIRIFDGSESRTIGKKRIKIVKKVNEVHYEAKESIAMDANTSDFDISITACGMWQ